MIEVAQPQTAPPGAPRVVDIAGVDLSDPHFWEAGDPHEALDRVRAAAPVAWQDERVWRSVSATSGLPAPPSPGYWAVTGHALVEQVSKHPELFSSELGGVQLHNVDPITLAGVRLMMLVMDPPAQVRLRKIVSPAFNPRSVAAMKDFVVEQAKAVADDLVGAGEVDLVDTMSKELTTRVLARLLGVPDEDRGLMVRWTDALIAFEANEEAGTADETLAAHMELFAYGRAVHAQRLAQPGDDLMSQLANAEVEGERLTEDEFCFFWLLLIIAGNETTRNTLSGSVVALQEHGLWHDLALRGGPLGAVAVEELIRYVTPVIQFRRTATRDVVLGGRPVRAGDKVVLYYPGANRDPAVFGEPHRLDLGREPNHHLAFGVGPHFCLGTRLARLQIDTMLTELLARFPAMTLAGAVERTRSSFIAGIARLPVDTG